MKTLLVAALLGMGAVTAGAAEARPNILFCLADDWAWPHAGAYGDKTIRTPTFDRIAREGVLFNYCFSAAPSCSPSRAAMLTGQYPHRLAEGGNLWGFLPKKYPNYVDLLEQAGYVVGFTRKGWGPGNFQAGGYSRNPGGPRFATFAAFLKTVPADKPFCFWFTSNDPHRPYVAGSGAQAGLTTNSVVVPPMWPDNAVSRNDILDYYAKAERFDREAGEMVQLLQQAGKLDNTIVLMTGDNGWPFPRCKANLYDGGTRQPLAVRWPAKVKPRQVCEDFINLMDMAPTFLQAAGLKAPAEMTGRGFLGLLTGTEKFGLRNTVFLERERHANVRAGDVGYPARAIRTREFLYIHNFRPERWPAGDPVAHKDPARAFGDCDDGPTKNFILAHKEEPGLNNLFQLCFGKRPAEELYDARKDPHQLRNLADDPACAEVKKQLRAQLEQWMRDTADPRANRDEDPWDRYPYYGGGGPASTKGP
jgi:N-sulfoglucosamine sulfohydrolase